MPPASPSNRIYARLADGKVPFDVKRVRIAENVDTIPERTFYRCYQLIDVEGHNKLKENRTICIQFLPYLEESDKNEGPHRN